MKAHWNKLAAVYDAYSRRERWMIAAAVLGGIVLIGAMLFLDPAMQRSRLADQALAEQQAQLTSLQSQLVILQSPGQDPDVAARAGLAEFKRRLAELGGRFADIEATLVPPQRMPGLLEELIGRSSGLRLLSLRTLPVAPVLDKKAGEDNKSADASSGLYKHGVEIRLEGSYQELAAYLARLEKSPAKLLWGGVALSTDKHPKLVLVLTVFYFESGSHMADRMMRILATLVFFALATTVSAQSEMADPTRPPAGLALAGEGGAGEPSGPLLQSVMIPKKGKPGALIGGQQVLLGGMYGESRLISVTEREVVLEGPAGIEHLYLTPGIEKINVISKTPAARRGQSKGKS